MSNSRPGKLWGKDWKTWEVKKGVRRGEKVTKQGKEVILPENGLLSLGEGVRKTGGEKSREIREKG